MTGFDAEIFLLAVGAALWMIVAVRLRKRLQSGEDFILGRRRLDAGVGAIGIAINGVPIWWLLLIVAAAYTNGRSAVWLALAMFGGIVVTGWTIAPRLRSRAQMQHCNTILQLLAGDAGEKLHAMLMRSAALIIAIALTLMLAAQLQLIADFLAPVLAMSRVEVVIMAALILSVALLFSGLWIALVGDIVQTALFIGVSVTCIAAILLRHSAPAAWIADDWFAGQSGLLSVSFLVGIGFLIGDAMGQSPLLTRFMACKDDADLIAARKRAVLWAMLLLLLALVVGWIARAFAGPDRIDIDGFRELMSNAFSTKGATLLTVLVAMSLALAAGNGLITAASHFANDVKRGGTTVTLARCRVGLGIAALLAAGFAIYLPETTPQANLARMLFSWHALGAAFGPLVIVRLTGKRVRPGSMLGAMWAGFLLTIVFHLMPETPGDLLERSLPFTTSLGIALSGGERRRNPDRADRGDRTIHDRLPI